VISRPEIDPASAQHRIRATQSEPLVAGDATVARGEPRRRPTRMWSQRAAGGAVEVGGCRTGTEGGGEPATRRPHGTGATPAAALAPAADIRLHQSQNKYNFNITN